MIELQKTSYLDHTIRTEPLHGDAFTDEQGGHKFIITCYQHGERVNLTGTISGRFMRPGGTVTLTGSVSDGQAIITLSSECYERNGGFLLTVFNTVGNDKFVIYACTGNVRRSKSDPLIDGGEIIDSVEDLIDDIQTATAQIPVNYNASFAPAYSTTSSYAVGSYATNNGNLYRCTTAITSGETFDPTHWTQVALGNDVADLKNAINDIYAHQTETNLQSYLTTNGGIKYSDGTNNNASSSVSTYFRSDYIPVNIGDRITYFATGVSTGTAVIAFYDEGKTYNQALSVAGTNTASQTGSIIISSPGYIRLVCKQTGIQENGNFSIISQSGWADEKLSDRIELTENALKITLTTSDVVWELGSIATTGANNPSDVRIRSGFIPAKCSSVQFDITAGYRFAAVWYNENKDIPCLRDDYWFTENTIITPPDGTAYLRILISKVPEETATLAYADEIEAVGLLSVNDLSDDLRKAEQDIVSVQSDIDEIQSALNYDEPTEAISLLTETGHITATGIVKDEADPPVYMHSDYIPFEKGGTVSYTDVRVTNMCAIALYHYPREGDDSFDAENSVILSGKSSGLFEMPYNGYIRLCCRIAEINNGASFVLLNRTGSAIQNLDNRVTALENDIPSYWKTYMENKYPILWEKDGQIGSGGDSFVFITDLHYERNELHSPKIIKQITEKTAVKNVFCGGDLIDHQDTAALAIEKLESWQSMFSDMRVFNIVGNHDNNNYNGSQPSAALTKGQFYGIMVKPEEQWINTGGELYYCVDNESQKIRYICLAIECFDDVGVSGTQRTWLQSKLTEKDNSWTILVIQHRIWGSSTASIATNAQNVINAINEVWANINAKFIGIIAGHTHLDYNITEPTHGYNLIAVNCDANTGSNSGYTRTAGTTTEQSFDVMYIDKTTSKMYAVRIGAGDTSVGGGTGIREFSY